MVNSINFRSHRSQGLQGFAMRYARAPRRGMPALFTHRFELWQNTAGEPRQGARAESFCMTGSAREARQAADY